MKNLFVFIGEGGSGKTTLVGELTDIYPEQFKKVVTYTSRSRRGNEIHGRDYYFVNLEFFGNNQELVLVKNDDENFYGTKKEDLFSDTHHLLLTSKIAGIPKLINLGFENIVTVRMLISEELKVERMRHRGDTEEAIRDRLILDEATRVDVDISQLPFIDLDARQPIREKMEAILRYVNA